MKNERIGPTPQLQIAEKAGCFFTAFSGGNPQDSDVQKPLLFGDRGMIELSFQPEKRKGAL